MQTVWRETPKRGEETTKVKETETSHPGRGRILAQSGARRWEIRRKDERTERVEKNGEVMDQNGGK
jgi:hypothetical protein